MRKIYIDMHFDVVQELSQDDRDKLATVLKNYEFVTRKRIVLRPSNGESRIFTITRTRIARGHQSKLMEYVVDKTTFKFLSEDNISGVPAEVRELAKRIRRVVEAAQRSERLNALLDGPVQLILSDSA